MENWVEHSRSFDPQKPWLLLDLDKTLVIPQEDRPFPKNKDDWDWMWPAVGIREALRKHHKKQGYQLVLVSNQTKPWKRDLVEAVRQDLGVPTSVVVAFQKADHKPATRLFKSVFPEAPPPGSVFVGDAAGRPGDHSDSDREFARRLGVPFQTPEEFFLSAMPTPSPPKYRRPLSQWLVVLVGYPAAGKTALAHSAFPDASLLKSDVRLTAFAPADQMIVVDAGHATREKRKVWVQWARANGRKVACLWLDISLPDAMRRNAHRPPEQRVPNVAFYTFRKQFEEPTSEEGFDRLDRLRIHGA